MIPAGDHSSRSLLLRRVFSWSEVTPSQRRSDRGSWNENDDFLDVAYDHLSSPQERIIDGNNTSNEYDDQERYNENENVRIPQQEHHQNHILDPSSGLMRNPFFPSLEYESASMDDDTSSGASLLRLSERSRKEWKLWLVFSLLVVSGVGNVVLAKLQSLPMYNYPTFLNVYANFVYIIMSSVCYILPAIQFGWFQHSISWRHVNMNKKPFLVMGFLDAIAATMQVLSTIYLPGTLLILLPQVAIPLSMIASRLVLRESFTWHQIIGASVVLGGIIVVLMPVLTHQRVPDYSCQAIMGNKENYCSICEMEVSEIGCRSHVKEDDFGRALLSESSINDTVSLFCEWVSKEESIRHDDSLVFVWSIVMVASCIPMVFSTVYKQVALQVEMDPILVNCFVATFQLLFGIPLAIPAGAFSSPQVTPWHLPQNWWSATKCLFLQANTVEMGCHPDDCSKAALFVHLGLLSTAVYTISMMLVLKYGSASLLYLGLTVVVPLGHLIFSIHSPESVHLTDALGLVILLAGLVLYRFGNDTPNNSNEGGDAYIINAGTYHRLGDDGDEERLRIDDPTITLVDDPREDIPPGHARNHTGETTKEGFLEFLREPFLMVGDI